MKRIAWTLFAAFVTAGLAGCTEGPAAPKDLLEVTESTGGLHGVVIDSRINPVLGATVTIMETGDQATTDKTGAYIITGLPGGTYLAEATHPLYDVVQQSVVVEAGVAAPEPVNFQLERVIPRDPYMILEKYAGFIVCSIGQSYVASEECGEGVGVDEAVPGIGGQRIGGQGNNQVQYDFNLDGDFVQSVVVEQTWEPTTGEAGQLFTLLATNWTCLPVCDGNELDRDNGPPNLALRIDGEMLQNETRTSDEGRFSTFTWANWGNGWLPDRDNPPGDPPTGPEQFDRLNVVLNQEFELFTTAFYYLPAPEGWSFLAGDVDPFKQ